MKQNKFLWVVVLILALAVVYLVYDKMLVQTAVYTEALDDFRSQTVRLSDAAKAPEEAQAIEALEVELAVMREVIGRVYDAGLEAEWDALQEMTIAYEYYVSDLKSGAVDRAEALKLLERDFSSMTALIDTPVKMTSRRALRAALSKVLLESDKVEPVEAVMQAHTYFRMQ